MDDELEGIAYIHFIARLNNTFEETWSTRIGGDQYQYGSQFNEQSRPRLAVDELDNIYMYGSTASGSVLGDDPIAPFVANGYYYSNDVHGDFPSTYPASVYDTYLLKFDPTTDLVHSTIFGGPGQDYAAGITAMGDRIYVCGATGSQMFPTNAPVIPGATPYLATTPSTATGDLDAFMAQLGFDITIGVEGTGGRPRMAPVLFPNPTTGDLIVSGLRADPNSTIEVWDMVGRRVLNGLLITGPMVVLPHR